jgi:hypothetical protein
MEMSDNISPPRTVGITAITVNGAFTTMTVSFRVREPIVLPPFGYTNASREKAIYGVNQIQIRANMRDFNRGLSLAIPGGCTISNITMVPSQQSVLAVFVTPDNRSLADARLEAQTFRYDYNTVQTFTSVLTGGVVVDATSVSGSSNSFQLPVIPEKILIFAMYSETDRLDQTLSLPDAFMPITSIQLQAGTQAGILSGATQMDLYAMSLKNGARTSFFNFAGLPQISSSNAGNQANGSGGPLVVDVAADLQLPDGMTPGMRAQWQFAVSSVVCENRYGRNITAPRLVIVAITGGIIENEGGNSKVIVGGVDTLDADSLRQAPSLSSIEFHRAADDAGFGGSKIGDWFKKAAGTVWDGVKSAGEAVLHAAPELIEAASMAAGRGGAVLGGRPLGGRSLGGRPLGGAILGGARMQRSLLYQ